MGKIDLQGLIRTLLTLGVIVGGYYYTMGRIDTHIDSKDIHTTRADLSEIFVPRSEWQSNHNALREDVKYLRGKIDAIYDKITYAENRKNIKYY